MALRLSPLDSQVLAIPYQNCPLHPKNKCQFIKLTNCNFHTNHPPKIDSKLQLVCQQCQESRPNSVHQQYQILKNAYNIPYINLSPNFLPPNKKQQQQKITQQIPKFHYRLSKYLTQYNTTKKTLEHINISKIFTDIRQELTHNYQLIKSTIINKLNTQKQQILYKYAMIENKYHLIQKQIGSKYLKRQEIVQYIQEILGINQNIVISNDGNGRQQQLLLLQQSKNMMQILELKLQMSSQYGYNNFIKQIRILGEIEQQLQERNIIEVIKGIKKQLEDMRNKENFIFGGIDNVINRYQYRRYSSINGNGNNMNSNANTNTNIKMMVNNINIKQQLPYIVPCIGEKESRQRSDSGRKSINTQRTKRNQSFGQLPNLPMAPKTSRNRQRSHVNLLVNNLQRI